MSAVLVVGATGTVGSRAVERLRGAGEPVRAFVRDPRRAASLLGRGVDLAIGDLDDPGSVRAALEGADRVLLSSGNDPRQAEREMGVIDAAAAAGARRIVKVSTVGARDGSPYAFAGSHGRVEGHLARSGVPSVVLRSGFLMSNLLAAAGPVRGDGILPAPAGDARIAMIDPADVAAVAAATLGGDGHDGRTYVLTGPEALTHAEVAALLAEAAGGPVRFVDVPEEAARTQMLAAGMPGWLADGICEVYRQLRAGVNAQVTDLVRVLTGRDPRGLRAFLADHAEAFASARPAPA